MITYTIRRSDSCKTTDWEGGTTTELFIYPENARYDRRDFAFRCSSATVRQETSRFTRLPGFIRRIMLLEGRLSLVHEGYHIAELKRYQTDIFNGGWHTRSFGKCVDFNLMYAKDWNGDLYVVESNSSPFCLKKGFTGLFARTDIEVVTETAEAPPHTANLQTGDFLMIHIDGVEATTKVTATDAGADAPPAVIVTVRCERTAKEKNQA